MLIKKNDHWFVTCECGKELPYAYVDRRSAEADIREYKWELTPEDKCYCTKCKKGI